MEANKGSLPRQVVGSLCDRVELRLTVKVVSREAFLCAVSAFDDDVADTSLIIQYADT